MADITEPLLVAVNEIRELLRLLAEPQIAARDQKLRDDLLRVVGRSAPKQKSVFLMDGTRTQTEIRKLSGIQQGHLSTLVKQLGENKLVEAGDKQPKLSIAVPATFFEAAK